MKKEAVNLFSEGLVMDLNPMMTPNNVLTNCLNGTLFTNNGNEGVLQNDMGNGRVETAFLPEGFIPVGTCEFGDIIYIVSYNPLIDKAQIGCFPSPERNISSEETTDRKQSLSYKDFQEEVENEGKLELTGNIKSMQKRLILYDKKIHPGDKYFIYTTEETEKTNLGTIKDNLHYITDVGNTSHTISDFPKMTKISVVLFQEDGKMTYLDSSVKWYEGKSGKIPTDYFIQGEKKTSTGKPDIDSYRDILQSGYSVLKTKHSGQLGLLVELEAIQGFSCAHKLYNRGKETKTLYRKYIDTAQTSSVNTETVVPNLVMPVTFKYQFPEYTTKGDKEFLTTEGNYIIQDSSQSWWQYKTADGKEHYLKFNTIAVIKRADSVDYIEYYYKGNHDIDFSDSKNGDNKKTINCPIEITIKTVGSSLEFQLIVDVHSSLKITVNFGNIKNQNVNTLHTLINTHIRQDYNPLGSKNSDSNSIYNVDTGADDTPIIIESETNGTYNIQIGGRIQEDDTNSSSIVNKYLKCYLGNKAKFKEFLTFNSLVGKYEQVDNISTVRLNGYIEKSFEVDNIENWDSDSNGSLYFPISIVNEITYYQKVPEKRLPEKFKLYLTAVISSNSYDITLRIYNVADELLTQINWKNKDFYIKTEESNENQSFWTIKARPSTTSSTKAWGTFYKSYLPIQAISNPLNENWYLDDAYLYIYGTVSIDGIGLSTAQIGRIQRIYCCAGSTLSGTISGPNSEAEFKFENLGHIYCLNKSNVYGVELEGFFHSDQNDRRINIHAVSTATLFENVKTYVENSQILINESYKFEETGHYIPVSLGAGRISIEQAGTNSQVYITFQDIKYKINYGPNIESPVSTNESAQADASITKTVELEGSKIHFFENQQVITRISGYLKVNSNGMLEEIGYIGNFFGFLEDNSPVYVYDHAKLEKGVSQPTGEIEQTVTYLDTYTGQIYLHHRYKYNYFVSNPNITLKCKDSTIYELELGNPSTPLYRNVNIWDKDANRFTGISYIQIHSEKPIKINSWIKIYSSSTKSIWFSYNNLTITPIKDDSNSITFTGYIKISDDTPKNNQDATQLRIGLASITAPPTKFTSTNGYNTISSENIINPTDIKIEETQTGVYNITVSPISWQGENGDIIQIEGYTQKDISPTDDNITFNYTVGSYNVTVTFKYTCFEQNTITDGTINIKQDNEEIANLTFNSSSAVQYDQHINKYDVWLDFSWSTANNDVNPSGYYFIDTTWKNPSNDNKNITHINYNIDDSTDDEFSIEVNPNESGNFNISYILGEETTYKEFKQSKCHDAVVEESLKTQIDENSKYQLKHILTSQYGLTPYLENGVPSEENKYYVNPVLQNNQIKYLVNSYSENGEDKFLSQPEYIEARQIELFDNIVNNYYQSSVLKHFATFEIPTITTTQDNQTTLYGTDTSNLVYNYKVCPTMPYGKLDFLSCDNYIDFSKLGQNNIEINTWKYYNSGNNCTLMLGLSDYLSGSLGQAIQSIHLEFYDNQGIAAVYHITDKNSYSGTFTENFLFNTNTNTKLDNKDATGNEIIHAGLPNKNPAENLNPVYWNPLAIKDTFGYNPIKCEYKERGRTWSENSGYYYKDEGIWKEITDTDNIYINDAGILYENFLYKVRIVYKIGSVNSLGEIEVSNQDNWKYDYRWFWTNSLNNEYYFNTTDFSYITPNLILDPHIQWSGLPEGSSTAETPASAEPDKANTVVSLENKVTYTDQIAISEMDIGFTNNYNTFQLYGDYQTQDTRNVITGTKNSFLSKETRQSDLYKKENGSYMKLTKPIEITPRAVNNPYIYQNNSQSVDWEFTKIAEDTYNIGIYNFTAVARQWSAAMGIPIQFKSITINNVQLKEKENGTKEANPKAEDITITFADGSPTINGLASQSHVISYYPGSKGFVVLIYFIRDDQPYYIRLRFDYNPNDNKVRDISKGLYENLLVQFYKPNKYYKNSVDNPGIIRTGEGIPDTSMEMPSNHEYDLLFGFNEGEEVFTDNPFVFANSETNLMQEVDNVGSYWEVPLYYLKRKDAPVFKSSITYKHAFKALIGTAGSTVKVHRPLLNKNFLDNNGLHLINNHIYVDWGCQIGINAAQKGGGSKGSIILRPQKLTSNGYFVPDGPEWHIFGTKDNSMYVAVDSGEHQLISQQYFRDRKGFGFIQFESHDNFYFKKFKRDINNTSNNNHIDSGWQDKKPFIFLVYRPPYEDNRMYVYNHAIGSNISELNSIDAFASFLYQYRITSEQVPITPINFTEFAYFRPYKTIFTYDVVTQTRFKEEKSNYNDVIRLRDCRYIDYLAKVNERLSENAIDTNINIMLNHQLKTHPIKFEIEYRKPKSLDTGGVYIDDKDGFRPMSEDSSDSNPDYPSNNQAIPIYNWKLEENTGYTRIVPINTGKSIQVGNVKQGSIEQKVNQESYLQYELTNVTSEGERWNCAVQVEDDEWYELWLGDFHQKIFNWDLWDPNLKVSRLWWD